MLNLICICVRTESKEQEEDEEDYEHELETDEDTKEGIYTISKLRFITFSHFVDVIFNSMHNRVHVTVQLFKT